MKKSKTKNPSDLVVAIRADLRVLTGHTSNLIELLMMDRKYRIVIQAAIALFCILSLVFVRVQFDNQPIVGDQPHYMLMEYSLVNDGDFNLANNFANRDSDTFGIYPPDGLTPDGQVGPGQVKTPDHQYSIHGIGLTLLMVPGYVLGHTMGVQILMIMISVLVLFLTYYWSKAITKNAPLSFLASLVLFGSYIFYGLAGYIFPDIVMGGIIVASLLIVVTRPYDRVWQVVLGLLLGFGFLVHYKMLAFAVPVVLILSYLMFKEKKTLPYFVVLPCVFFGCLLLYLNHKWFNVWNPADIITDLGVGMHLELIFHNISAVLFDSARGLIPSNPIFILLFPGLAIWFNKNRKTLLITGASIFLSLIAYVSFNDWGGGDAPAGRYTMNFLPVVMPALTYVFIYAKKLWQRAIIAVLVAASFLITLYLIKIELGWLGVEGRGAHSSPILYGTPLASDRFFPQFVGNFPNGQFDWQKILLYCAIIIGLTIYGYKISKDTKTTKVSR